MGRYKNYLFCIRSILMKTLEMPEKNVGKLIAVYLITYISVAINLRLLILVLKQSLDNAVLYGTNFATLRQLKAKI